MNVIDYGIIFIIVISALLGMRSGVIKGFVSLVMVLMSTILAYQFKDILANYLIDIMPFYNFAGLYENITSISVLFFNGVSFMILFIIIYSVLNIALVIAGFIDKLINMTVVLALPNKLLGAGVGFIQGTLISFVSVLILAQMPHTHIYVIESTYGYQLLNKMPVVNVIASDSIQISQAIAEIITEGDNETEDGIRSVQMKIMTNYILRGLITADVASKLVEDQKIDLPGATFQQ